MRICENCRNLAPASFHSEVSCQTRGLILDIKCTCYVWLCLLLSSACRSMTSRLLMAFSMWRWEAFPRATDPSSSPITTSASTVSQPETHLDCVLMWPPCHRLFDLCLPFQVWLPDCLLPRQVMLQHPVQLRGHAGDHAALCGGSRGRARPAGGGTSLPKRVGVRPALQPLMNGNTFIFFAAVYLLQ